MSNQEITKPTERTLSKRISARASDSTPSTIGHLTPFELNRMLDTLIDGVVRVDLDGRITYANLAAEQILEVRKDVALQRYYYERFWQQIDETGAPYPPERLPLAIALREKRPVVGLEHGIIAPNGEVRWLSVNAAPLLNEHGEIYGAIASFRDITAPKETVDALKISEERFRMAVYHSGIVFAQNDRDLRYTWIANPHPDFDPQAALGKRDLDLVDNAGTRALVRMKQRVIETGQRLRQDIRFPVSEGCRIYDIIAQPLWGVGGKVDGVATCALDITARERAEAALRESEARFRGFVKEAAEGFVLTDTQGRIVEWNRAEAEITGMPRDEVLGMPIWKMLYHWAPEEAKTGDQGERLAAHLRETTAQCLRTGEAPWLDTWVERRLQRPDGEVRIVHSIVFSIAINDSFAMGSATRDITELDRVEQERARYAADLARSNRDLEQFGYIISHDLQTPLRTVTGFLGLLRSRYGDQLDDRAGGYVDRAIEGAERMKAMIRAMLDLSRVESRGGTLTSVDSGAVLARTLRGLAADLEASGATVTHDPLPAVMADAVQLGQVFQNLIGNALKFRHKDVPPCVHVSAGHSDGMWVFFVQDNGIGLEPEGAARIFEVFQRLHTEEEYPGLGVGLALCRRIVERHGGRIWVASAPGQGASFFFTLHEAPGGDQERPDHPSSPD